MINGILSRKSLKFCQPSCALNFSLLLSIGTEMNSNRNNGCYRGFPRGRAAAPATVVPEKMAPSFQFHFADIPKDIVSRLKNSYSLLKKSENVRQMLLSFLESCENPYAAALQIVAECEDLFHNKANTLAAFVIEEFCSWAKAREKQIQHNLTPELKFDAFCLITMQRNSTLIKLIMETFKMAEDKELLIPKIHDFVLAKRYKEACQCATALGILHHFPIDHIILPLILQDKLPIAEEGLATDRGLQVKLITRLDQLVGERSLRNTVDHLVNQLDVPEVKLDRFMNHKPLGKLITKLVKTYNLPADSTPNLNQKRSAGALNFIFHKRFFEKSLSLDSWKEMAYDAVKSNYILQQELLSMLNGYNEVEEALYWALEFQIPQHKWPYNVSVLFNKDPLKTYEFPRPSEPTNQQKEELGDTSDYHTLPLPDSAIIMVDSEPLLKECLDYINNHEFKIVGIDSEWKPAFGGQQNELSLIQLATWDRIFILDVIGMSGIPHSAWHDASKLFFENADILKLGFSLGSDMTMMRSSITPLANMKLNGTGYLDLSNLWRRLQQKGMAFPYAGENGNSNGESLSRLVSLCFGHCLNKSDQFSNWEQRPLRIGQMRYAALDAFCLLQLHSEIQKFADQQGLPFLEICDEIIMGFRSPKKNVPSPGGFNRRGRGRGRRPGGMNPGHGPQGPSHGQDITPGDRSAGSPMLEETPGDPLEVGGTTEVDKAVHQTRVVTEERNIERTGATTAGTRGVDSVRFLADFMLFGLGRQLRKCGVDCAILTGPLTRMDNVEADAVIQDVDERDRVVLSQGRNVEWFEKQLWDGTVYRVRSASPKDQLKEVLDHFRITVLENDVFTRCMACNNDAFDKASQDVMLELAGIHADSLDEGSQAVDAGSSHSDVSISETIRNLILTENSPSMSQGRTLLGAEIQVHQVPLGILRKVKVFYVCSLCGKVYWDGSHFGRVVEVGKESGTIKTNIGQATVGVVNDEQVATVNSASV